MNRRDPAHTLIGNLIACTSPAHVDVEPWQAVATAVAGTMAGAEQVEGGAEPGAVAKGGDLIAPAN